MKISRNIAEYSLKILRIPQKSEFVKNSENTSWILTEFEPNSDLRNSNDTVARLEHYARISQLCAQGGRVRPDGAGARQRVHGRTLSETRSRLDRSRFSRPNTHLKKAFFEIYRKIIFSRANCTNFCKIFAKISLGWKEVISLPKHASEATIFVW